MLVKRKKKAGIALIPRLEQRQAVQEDTDYFLANGGQVTHIPTGHSDKDWSKPNQMKLKINLPGSRGKD